MTIDELITKAEEYEHAEYVKRQKPDMPCPVCGLNSHIIRDGGGKYWCYKCNHYFTEDVQ
jgi:transposase-like protein